MSVVPITGLIRKHYEEAIEDIEYKSSAFWQSWLQRAFFETDVYSVTSESSPDGSLRRVDMVVKRYDATHHTLSALLWIEIKRPTGSIKEVERQALDAALRCIAADGLIWIYAMTTVGVSFRTWFVEKDNPKLQPFHGTAVEGDWAQYIDADTEHAWVLNNTVDLVKQQIPLREAPVVPSQRLPSTAHEDYPEEEHGQGSAQETNQDLQQLAATSLDEFAGGEQDYPGEASSATQRGNAGTQRSREYVEVVVDKISHRFHSDEYLFRDVKGHRKTTTKDDWERTTYQNQTVWVFHGKKTTYVSRKKIG